jgi:hypothetical protein
LITRVPSVLLWIAAEMNPGERDATWSTMSTLICTTSSWDEGVQRNVLMKVA